MQIKYRKLAPVARYMKNHTALPNWSEDLATKDLPKEFHVAGENSQPPMGDETLDALFNGKLQLWQSRRGYRFSLDALLLAHFATVKTGAQVADLGTGSGVIALVLASLHANVAVIGFEAQPAMVERAQKNVKLNRLEKQIQIRRGDVRFIESLGSPQSVDVVVCNPPYRRRESGRTSPNDEKQIARHEIHGALSDFLNAGAFLLRPKGRIALVYLASRAVDLLASMRAFKIEPKRLRMVHSFCGGAASLVLVEGVKGGRAGARIEPPLMIYRRGKEYSDEAAAIIAGSE
jgi:tRNA1Val (adenine37-N6)-methyltransferase